MCFLLGRGGDVGQQADVVGDRQTFATLMPAGTVAHHHGVGVGANLAADFDQMLRYRLTAGGGHDDGGADDALRT